GPLQRRRDQPVGGGDLAGPQSLQGRRRRPSKLEITTMKALKRTVRRYGPVQGHRTGLHGDRLLPYEAARRQIYLPTYRWVLENRVADLIEQLRTKNDVVLLDYTTNADVSDPTSPLSHAALIQLRIEDRWPAET